MRYMFTFQSFNCCHRQCLTCENAILFCLPFCSIVYTHSSCVCNLTQRLQRLTLAYKLNAHEIV